jgi:tRNA-2-methylthio-N6-dimethylallyladenosine synthase
MNISDAERASAVLESAGYKNTPNINKADLIVITMCSVRKSAVDRVYGIVEKFEEIKKKKPLLKTILTGCIIKKDRKTFLNLFDYVIDIKDIKKIPNILGFKKSVNSINYLDITPKYSSKFSANVPIMTGCNNFCSYCVVPYAREREISRSAKKIVTEIKNLIKNNYKEIWLLGQNVNSYKDTNINFPKLLKLIQLYFDDDYEKYENIKIEDITNIVCF